MFARNTALALLGAICALAQSQSPIGSIRPLVVNKTQYRLRAGESVSIDAPRETLDFLLHATRRRAEVANKETHGFVFGPSINGDQVLLVASLALRPGDYRVTLSATTSRGEERVTTVDVTLALPSHS